MSLWWLSDWPRLAMEKARVETLAADGWFSLTRWHVHQFRLAVEGVITAHGAPYPVRLVYPDLFPDVPAWVEPQNGQARWSGHQYGVGGALCLELRPDNWQATATGADVLQSAYNLLYQENPLGEGRQGKVPSAHAVGSVQAYAWYAQPAMIGIGCLTRLSSGAAEDVQAILWQAEEGLRPLLLIDRTDLETGAYPVTFDLGTLRTRLPVTVVSVEVPHPRPTSRTELGHDLDLDFGETETQEFVVLALSRDHSHVTIYLSPRPDVVETRSLILLPEEQGLRSGRAADVVGKRVAVVGVGSVGSTVAELLTRSGVSRLVLVDGDVMLPGNLERHILDWRDVGLHKVVAVRRRLLHIAPSAGIEVVTSNLNWQRSARSQSTDTDLISTCDVIVNATGDVPTGMLLGALAERNGRAFVSAEVFEGGLGCLTARSLPGLDPTYMEGRMAYEAFCEEQNVLPPPSGTRTYEALTFDGAPIQADAAATTSTAAQTARIVLDILDDRVQELSPPWVLTGFRSGWLFTRQGESLGLDIPRRVQPAENEIDVETMNWANQLAREAINAARSGE